MPVKYMNCDDGRALMTLEYQILKLEEGSGRKNKKGKGKDKNPDGKYTSKHVHCRNPKRNNLRQSDQKRK